MSEIESESNPSSGFFLVPPTTIFVRHGQKTNWLVLLLQQQGQIKGSRQTPDIKEDVKEDDFLSSQLLCSNQIIWVQVHNLD